MPDEIDFSDLCAIGYERHELQKPYFTFVNKVWKTAFVYDSRESIAASFIRGIQGKIWIDHTGAWNVQYAKARDGKTEATFLPINEVLPLLGYKQNRE